VTETSRGALPLPVVPGLTDLQVFARGGYATVYRAIQRSVGREVAVKVENRTLDSERDQARFLREARAAGRMSSHPHVVDLFDVGVTDDQHPYLIMELCDGSYAERMRSSPLDPAEARDLGIKIADALAHAHASGVLHRDVKPANILYQQFNTAVLADFGLAVLAEARDSSVTLEVLTPAYAPPEMFRHSPPSPAVDVYALCATLYAVMQGKPPRWQSDRNPSLITLMELFQQPIPELPGIPASLIDVLRAGMLNDPSQRPSATQLRELLVAVPLPTPAGTISPISGAPSMPISGAPGAPISGAPISGGPASGAPISGGPTSGAPTSGAGPSDVYGPGGRAGPAVPWGTRPPAEPPYQDATPTVRTPLPRRGLRWFLGGLGVLALMAAAAATSWAIAARPGGPAPAPTGGARTSATARVSPSSSGGGVLLPDCLVPLPGASRCPAELECFGPVLVRGAAARADQVSCTGRHTFESYAEGDVPEKLPASDYQVVKKDPTVRQVCGASTFVRVTMQSPTGWILEVLPPTEKAAAGGDRTYRCLAGKGADQLSAPTLGH
jgi:tRNA A-37 threonylcarbamoyl transferase component Bud32